MRWAHVVGLGALLASAALTACSETATDDAARTDAPATDAYGLASVSIRDQAGEPVPAQAQAIVDDNLRVGDPAIYERLRGTIHDLQAYYQQAGYPHVNVIPFTSQDDDAHTLTIELVIQRGPAAG